MKNATIGDLKPDKNNARRHNPRNIGMVETSLQTDGFGRSILLDAGGNILAGNGVTEASGNVGIEDVLIVPSDGTRIIAIQRTDVEPGSERAVRLAIADNRTQELSDFDPVVVAALAEEVDLSDFWRDDELDALLAGMETEPPAVGDDPGASFDNALVEKYGVAQGQIWQLGLHRLLVGDCTDGDAVARLMDGESARWMWSDPPYGVSYVGKTKDALTIENDGAEGLPGLLAAAFGTADGVLEDGCPIYIAHPAGALCIVFLQAFVGVGWHLHETLVWVKNSMVLGHSDYHYRHEPILYGWKGASRHWYAGRDQVSVFEVDRPSRSEEHPTMKPVDLIVQHLNNSSRRGDLGYEPFVGSGSTLVAAEQTGRRCYACEIDEAYAATCIERMSGMGLTPRLVERDGTTDR